MILQVLYYSYFSSCRTAATAPEEKEKANMVSMGIERLQQIVQQPTERYASEQTGDESAMSETLDSDISAEMIRYQGRGRKKEKKEKK